MAGALTKQDVQEVVDKSIDKFSIELFRYLSAEFNKIDQKFDQRFDETDKKIDLYANAVVAFAKQSETYMQEMLALGKKVDRLEKWIAQIADATGVKLSLDI